MKNHVSLFVSFLLCIGCSTTKSSLTKIAPIDYNRVDSHGCMISHQAPVPPPIPMTFNDVTSSENYYEKLEFYFLLSAENCFSDSVNCLAFEEVLKDIPGRFVKPPTNDNADDITLATKHGNNKLIAMVAINAHYYQLYKKKTLPSMPWLVELANENDFTTETMTLNVASENKKYGFQSHNMAIASGRAYVFVGLLEKSPRLIQKGLAQIPKVLQSMRADGSLPLETRRGARAIRYSMQVLSDIVAMLATSKEGKALYQKHRKSILAIAAFDLKALKDTSLVAKYAMDNFSPGPITDPTLQDISSLRSRLAWIITLDKLEPGFMDKAEDIEIDKKSCSHPFLKKKPECAPLVHTIGDILDSSLGFTLGFNPKCIASRVAP